MQTTPTKRTPRKLNHTHDTQPIDSRASSLGGGVPLTQPAAPSTQSLPDKSQASRRRRPRKIVGNNPAQEQGSDRPDVTREIRKLEVRVQGIETQVQEIRLRSESTSGNRAGSKGARRRARRNKSAGATTDDETGAESAAVASEGDVEAVENEAGRGGNNSQSVALRKPDVEEPAEDDDDVEYIARPPPAPQPQRQPPLRSVTVSGSYRIPLPASVSDRDLRAVQRGIAGVQNIARRVLDEAGGGEAAARTVQATGTGGGSGWSAWLGAYSVSVARLVRGGDLSAGVEGPAVGAPPSVRWAGAVEDDGGGRRRPRKLRVGRESGSDDGLGRIGAESLLI